MRKISTLFLALFMFGVAQGQDITVFNFDGVTPTTNSWSDTFAGEANPFSDLVNSSANAGKYTHTNQWSDVSLNTSLNINPRVYTSFEVSVYTPTSTTGIVTIVCYDVSNNVLDWYSQPVTTAGVWSKFTRNLSFTSNIAKVAVGFNYGVAITGNSDDIVYFDNLVFKKPLSYTVYSEDFWANWSQWVGWVGAPSTVAGQWTGGINLQSAGDTNITLNREWNEWESYKHSLKLSPTDAPVTIPDIDISGSSDLQLSFENVWPWNQAENDGGFWGSPASQRTPIVEIKSGSGSWTTLSEVSSFWTDWSTQVIILPAIDNSLPLSIRFSPTSYTVHIDNVTLSGGTQYKFTGATNSDPTVSSNWIGGLIPGSSSDFTIISGNLVVDQNTTYNSIVVNPRSKLTLNDTKTLTLSTLLLRSNSTGTATFVDNNTTPTTIAATVQQHLPVTDRNWYLSAPISSATNADLNTGASVVEYNEQLGTWTTVNGALSPMKGYISTPGAAGIGRISFSGNLNSGTQSFILSRKGSIKAGFNLVGNPYPSYLVWTESLANSANCLSTIWYRTHTGGVYSFQTYNAAGNVGVPASTTGYISPMQAFWVRTSVDGSTLTVNNSMRSHGNGSLNLLKAPTMQHADKMLIRLKISNLVANDETLLYADANASNELDKYDSPKMSGSDNSLPEIYTLINGETMVINGMNTIPENTEIPLGINGNSELRIKATEVTNLNTNTQILLIDKLLGQSFDLSAGDEYVFDNSGVNFSANRLSIIYKTNNTVASNGSLNNDILIYGNGKNIVVNANGLSESFQLSVYNSQGKLILTKYLSPRNSVLDTDLASGMYLVKILYAGNELNQKVILK